MVKAHIGTYNQKNLTYDLNTLTRHAAILGTTGSGKTVMSKVLVEEALRKGVPVIAIDPKGDIGGLGITNEHFDFRPFVAKRSAQKVANTYATHAPSGDIPLFTTHIYTPKSSAGKSVSFLPDLSAPKHFKKLDQTIVASFVEPVSESILQLAGMKGSSKEKVQSLISSLLIHNWNDGKDLTFESLIQQIIDPPFDTMGPLHIDEVINEKERKKAASHINILLTSPSKRAWSIGESLDIKQLFKPSTLSVFDLRHLATVHEKQFVAEQIMQKIYRFLLSQGGTSKLKYLLYFDELAGFLPPPPARPPSKKLLELLIRQARAFGLGIILATQNPGDIDYRVFGNVGTRFIGKLRTDNDIDKVSSAMGLTLSQVKEDIATLQTGDFIYNNAVTNTTKCMHARWLYSYHGGPLKPQEIAWINDPQSCPYPTDTLRAVKDTHLVKKQRTPRKIASVQSVKKNRVNTQKKIVVQPSPKRSSSSLLKLEQTVKKYADTSCLHVALTGGHEFKPYLQVSIKPHDKETHGPYLFDLTSKVSRDIDEINHLPLKKTNSRDFIITPPRRNVREVIERCYKQACTQLNTKIYKSTLTHYTHEDRDVVEKHNKEHLKSTLKALAKRLELKHEQLMRPHQQKILSNTKKIALLRTKTATTKGSRMLKQLISNRKLAKSTQQMRNWKKRIVQLQKENRKHKNTLVKIKSQLRHRKQRAKDALAAKAFSSVKEKYYRPSKHDVTINASVLLVPVT